MAFRFQTRIKGYRIQWTTDPYEEETITSHWPLTSFDQSLVNFNRCICRFRRLAAEGAAPGWSNWASVAFARAPATGHTAEPWAEPCNIEKYSKNFNLSTPQVSVTETRWWMNEDDVELYHFDRYFVGMSASTQSVNRPVESRHDADLVCATLPQWWRSEENRSSFVPNCPDFQTTRPKFRDYRTIGCDTSEDWVIDEIIWDSVGQVTEEADRNGLPLSFESFEILAHVGLTWFIAGGWRDSRLGGRPRNAATPAGCADATWNSEKNERNNCDAQSKKSPLFIKQSCWRPWDFCEDIVWHYPNLS